MCFIFACLAQSLLFTKELTDIPFCSAAGIQKFQVLL